MCESRAQLLFIQHSRRHCFESFTGAHQVSDVDNAYSIQDEFVELLKKFHNATIAGWKIGLTSLRMQQLLGINTPIAGAVLANRLHKSGTTADRKDFGRLGIECEIAVRLKRDLPPSAAPYNFSAVSSAIDGVCPAIEMIDDRAHGFIYSLCDSAGIFHLPTPTSQGLG
eukprot:EG_transcript_26215